ncbi:hypothetical protein PUR49_11160 [Streptomyces sp. BE147]|uniref:hypothetical protein n=1 Tax=Streptomyces sp. BE147 TaxID=3002524 RepID=UPI002E7919F4|nr:hypothetical protein [Streptomyces sp. BE147]MEE1737054.1 hypothetical protein [Streptomyces sp. BE147]
MHHRAVLERVLRVQAAMDAVSVPDRSRFELAYLDALVRRYAAEQGYPSSLWGKRSGHSLADWEGQQKVLVPLLKELMAGLRHWADHVPGEAADRLAWAERLQEGGLYLLSLRVREAIPDRMDFVKAVVERYREEIAAWHAQPDPSGDTRALFSLSSAGEAGGPVRAEVYSDPVTALLEFLHRDRPGSRVRAQLHEPGQPAQPLPVADLWSEGLRSASLSVGRVIDSYRLQWLRHRLADTAPPVSFRQGSADRDRWATAAVDWALTFNTVLTEREVEAALEQDAGPHSNDAQTPLHEYHPLRAGELSAPGSIHRPVPADWRQLTNEWSTWSMEALTESEEPLKHRTEDLAAAFAVLEPMRDHPDGVARRAADDVLTELTWRFPRAQQLRVLLGPEVSDVEGVAEPGDNPYVAPAVMDSARMQMRGYADKQARLLTSEHYCPTAGGAGRTAMAEADLMVQTMLRPPGLVLDAMASPDSLGAAREVAGSGPHGLRQDPHGVRWRSEHPRHAASLTNRSMEAARASVNAPPGRAVARRAYERARTGRLEALHALLGRLQAHRPDPVKHEFWAARRATPSRASEVDQMLDRAAVLAVFPTFQVAHLHLEGMIATLSQQVEGTAANLTQSARSQSSGNRTDQDLSMRLHAEAQVRENAWELQSLIDACARLDELSPATAPGSRLHLPALSASAEKIMRGELRPAASSSRRPSTQEHESGQDPVHPQGQTFTGRQP